MEDNLEVRWVMKVKKYMKFCQKKYLQWTLSLKVHFFAVHRVSALIVDFKAY
jgi:hypothetical protein